MEAGPNTAESTGLAVGARADATPVPVRLAAGV